MGLIRLQRLFIEADMQKLLQRLVMLIGCAAVAGALCHPVFAEGPARRQLNVSVYDQAFGITSEGTPDPMKTSQMQYFNLQHQVFETLVKIDLNTNTVLPLLAEKWERIDQLTVRFYLRHGVRFHNDERFNSSAVKFTLDLMRNPRSRFAGRFLLDTIEEVTVVDDHTVDIKTRTYDGMLLRKLAAIGFVIPPVYYNRVGESYFSRHPIGTGPLRFFYADDAPSGYKKIHFIKNEQYWRSLDMNFDELVYHCIAPDKQWGALRDGTLDMMVGLPLPPGSIKGSKNTTIFSELSLRNAALLLNVDKQGPLASLQVRQALQHAVRRQEIIKSGLDGYGMPLYAITPRGALGHCPKPPRYQEDVKKARALMSKAGYGDGVVLRMVTGAHEPSMTVAMILKKQLARAGITLEVNGLSREELLRKVIEPRLKGETVPNDFDMVLISGWPSLFGTGTHFYSVFLHSGGLFNVGTYRRKDSPIDKLYSAALAADDMDRLCADLRKLDTYLLDQALIVPLYQLKMVYGMRKNIRFNPGMNDMPLRFDQCRIIE
jgi:peptide/nickel transport system substrate-binding protein